MFTTLDYEIKQLPKVEGTTPFRVFSLEEIKFALKTGRQKLESLRYKIQTGPHNPTIRFK